jgi:hypothetical protein
MREGKKGKVVTVSGLILPVEWDEHDNVVAVVIETADEESFIVETDKKGNELLQFIHHEVEATGTTRREAEYGNVYIKVKTYTPLEKRPENVP